MLKSNKLEKRMNIVKLSWPIVIQNFLRTLFGMIDIYMIGLYSENAVGAIGVATNINFILIIMFFMISTGTSVVISQLNGAEDDVQASQAIMGSVNLFLVFSIIISAAMFFLSSGIISLFSLEGQTYLEAVSYLKIIGMFSFGMGMSTCFSILLQTHGYSKEPMIISLAANGLNVIGNYCFIFGKFGFPVLGVTGVAISTAATQILAAVAMLIYIIITGKIKIPFDTVFKVPKKVYAMILKMGIPNGGEVLSYVIAQLVIVYFVTNMGAVPLNAFTIARTMTRFVSMWSNSIGAGTMILTGYWVGAGRFDEAYKKVPKIWFVSFLIASFILAAYVIFRYPIASLWSDNPQTIDLIAKMFIVAVFVETGRTVNLIFINALKGAGDVIYPVVIGLFFMWIIGVGLAWVCGVKLAWGIIGAWVGVGADELSRGVVMIFRWRGRKWQSKYIAAKNDPETEKST